MERLVRFSARLLACGIAFAMMVPLIGSNSAASPATPQPTGATLTIHHRYCPEAYEATNFFADCHGTVGLVGIPFFIKDATVETLERAHTGVDGNATFEEVPPGRYEVWREPFIAGLAVPLVFCSSASAPGSAILSAAEPERIELDLAAGDEVICDWFSIPEVGWDGPRKYQLPVRTYLCERDPGGIGIAMGGLPEECRGIGGVTVRITTLDDEPIGRCTTGPRGGCEIATPFAIVVRAEVETATLPDGYQPKDNPMTSWVYTEFAAAIFVILPEDEVND